MTDQETAEAQDDPAALVRAYHLHASRITSHQREIGALVDLNYDTLKLAQTVLTDPVGQRDATAAALRLAAAAAMLGDLLHGIDSSRGLLRLARDERARARRRLRELRAAR